LTDFIGAVSLPLALSAALFGPLAGWFAGRRDRHPVTWLALGAALGPIALLLLGLAPPGHCPRCDTTVRGWPSECPVCGEPFSDRVAQGSRRGRVASARGITTMDIPPERSDSSSPIPLPVGRAPRARAAVRSDVPIGVLAGGTVARPQHQAVDSSEVLATGVYFGGTASLIVGSRYAIARHGRLLRLLGPVDRDPAAIAIERSLEGLTATAIGERLIISEARGDRLAIAFGALAGANGPELEIALSLPAERATSRPASG